MKKKIFMSFMLALAVVFVFSSEGRAADVRQWTDNYSMPNYYAYSGSNPEMTGTNLTLVSSVNAEIVEDGGQREVIKTGTLLKNGMRVRLTYEVQGDWFGTGRYIDSPPVHFIASDQFSADRLREPEQCNDDSLVSSGEKIHRAPMIVKYPKVLLESPNLDCDPISVDVPIGAGKFIATRDCTVDIQDVKNSTIVQALSYPAATDLMQEICETQVWECSGGYDGEPATCVEHWKHSDYKCPHTKNCGTADLISHELEINVVFDNPLNYKESCACVDEPMVSLQWKWEGSINNIQDFRVYRKGKSESSWKRIAIESPTSGVEQQDLGATPQWRSYQIEDWNFAGKTDTKFDYLVKALFKDGSLEDVGSTKTDDPPTLQDCSESAVFGVNPNHFDVCAADITVALKYRNTSLFKDGNGLLNYLDITANYIDAGLTKPVGTYGVDNEFNTVNNRPRLDLSKRVEYCGRFYRKNWADPNCSAEITKCEIVRSDRLKPVVNLSKDQCVGNGRRVEVSFENNVNISRWFVLQMKDLYLRPSQTGFNTCMNFEPSAEAWADSEHPDHSKMVACYVPVTINGVAQDFTNQNPPAIWNNIVPYVLNDQVNDLHKDGKHNFFAAACLCDGKCSSEFRDTSVSTPKSCESGAVDLVVNGEADDNVTVSPNTEMSFAWSTKPSKQFTHCYSSGENFDANPLEFNSSAIVLSSEEEGTKEYKVICPTKDGVYDNTHVALSDMVSVKVEEQPILCGSADGQYMESEPSCSQRCSDGSTCPNVSDDGSVFRWNCPHESGCMSMKRREGQWQETP